MMNALKFEKTGVSASGIFTIREYRAEEEIDFVSLIRMLQAGPCVVQEVVSYVFEGDDPLGIDARSFSAEEFIRMYPRMKAYGRGLAFDVIILADGHPVTVELSEGEPVIATNSLDKEIELTDLLAPGQEREGETENDRAENGIESDEEGAFPGGPDAFSHDFGKTADHVRKMAIAAMLLSSRQMFREVDMDVVIRMCLFHGFETAAEEDDLTGGDAPCKKEIQQNKPGEKKQKEIRSLLDGTEDRQIEEVIRLLNGPQWRDLPEIRTILEEMRGMETMEAQLYRALDRICAGQ